MRAYLGLGANLGDPRAQIAQAIERLERPYTAVVDRASWYHSRPLGRADQPDYLNTAVAIDTTLSPIALLAEVKAIERRLGRMPSAVRWGPRPLDIDVLLYGDRTWRSAALTIPHPGITERAFVLHPLAEIAPHVEVPGTGRSVSDLLDALGDAANAAWLVPTDSSDPSDALG